MVSFEDIKKELNNRNISNYDVYGLDEIVIEMSNYESLKFINQTHYLQSLIEKACGEWDLLNKVTTIEEVSELLEKYID